MRRLPRHLLAACVAVVAARAWAAPPRETLETRQLAPSLYLITGAGGNVVLMVGPDGVFLVDDKVAPMTPALRQAIGRVTNKPVRFVFNTHWHADHTGGNAVLGAGGAVIVAHDNVRKRLSSDQVIAQFHQKVPASPPAALPVITFADSLSFHLNGDDIDVVHLAPAHTDSDSMVRFARANVIHTGDTYVSMGYPFVDRSSGGHIDGFIQAADRVLALARPDTKIIPGHGPLSDRAQLEAWRHMIVTIRARVYKLAAAGKTLAEVQAARPTAEFDAKWGHAFISGPQLVEAIYADAPKKR